jgi:hypothetical protein
MRHGPVFVGTFGLAVLAPLVATLGPASAGASAHAPAALKAAAFEGAAKGRTVEYRGARIPVPAGWEVHWLDRDPARCVRLDRPAIYLGRPGAQPDCPAHLIGGAETVHVEPLGGASASAQRRRGPVRADRLANEVVRPNDDHTFRLDLPVAGVSISASYGADPLALQSAVRAIRLSSSWRPEASAERRATPAVRIDQRRHKWATGKGFDTCTAPSLGTMAAWRRTYAISNIYIGGAARGCYQPNLTASWVRSVRRMGYRLIPTYVGLQAPCTRFHSRFTTKNAATEGRKAAADAVRRAKALGIPRRKPIYFDIEAYDSRKTKCRQAVLAFLHSWSKGLKARHYVSGVYSSAGAAVRDLGWATGIMKPKSIWFAHWDGKARTIGSPYLPDTWWQPHKRIKQYRGGHREKHGGVTLDVDSNIVDGRVY